MPAKTMAVNVSGVQFQSEDFLDGLFAVLNKTGLDPEALGADVNESALMHHPERTASVLRPSEIGECRCRWIISARATPA